MRLLSLFKLGFDGFEFSTVFFWILGLFINANRLRWSFFTSFSDWYSFFWNFNNISAWFNFFLKFQHGFCFKKSDLFIAFAIYFTKDCSNISNLVRLRVLNCSIDVFLCSFCLETFVAEESLRSSVKLRSAVVISENFLLQKKLRSSALTIVQLARLWFLHDHVFKLSLQNKTCLGLKICQNLPNNPKSLNFRFSWKFCELLLWKYCFHTIPVYWKLKYFRLIVS